MPFPIRLADVMSSPVRTTAADATAAEAAATCSQEDIGSLVVVEDGEPVGIVTSSDFVELLGTDPDPGPRPVTEFMSSPVVMVSSDTPVGDAVERMVEEGIARVVVVEDDEPVGLVSTDDVIRHVPQVFHRSQFEAPPVERPQYRVQQETAYEAPDWEFECTCSSEEAVSVGDRVTFSKTISEQDVRSFAMASGDTNRLHLDDEYAEETRFEQRIVHGTLVGGLISAALARLPGLTIYVSQDVTFLSPVEIGERVTAVCSVTESLGREKYVLTTDVHGADGELVLEGEAVVLIDTPPAAARIEVEAVS